MNINSKKLISAMCATSLLTVLSCGQAMAKDDWNNRMSVLVGQKKLDKDGFEDSNHDTFGLSFDIKHQAWPVSIAIDVIASGKEQTIEGKKVERVTGGLHLGIRKHFLITDNVEPYIGGGVNFAGAERKRINNNVTETEDDSDVGYWLATGINWKFDNDFTMGVEVRYSDAEVTLFDSQVKTGGVLSAVSVGYQF